MGNVEVKTYMLTDIKLFARLQNYVIRLEPEFMFMDLETDSAIEKTANMYGIGICFTDTTAFYIPWRKQTGEMWWSEEDQQTIINWIKDTASNCKLINHNIIFDILVFENNTGVNLTDYVYSDTILQHHTLSEEPPHGLKDISVQILGDWADRAQQILKQSVLDNGGKWTKENKDMYLAETNILGDYCCWDVILTCKLFHIFEPQLIKEGLADLFYKDEIMPLYKEVAFDMKRKGFPIDVEHFQKLEIEMTSVILKIEKEIQNEVENAVTPFVENLLSKDFPVSSAANSLFPKKVAEYYKITLPKMKKKDKDTGEVTYTETLSAKALVKQKEATPEFSWFYDWIIAKPVPKVPEEKIIVQRLRTVVNEETGEKEKVKVDVETVVMETPTAPQQVEDCKREIQEQLFFRKKEAEDKARNYVFNLKSGDHLAHLLYESLGIECKYFTDGGKSGIKKPSTKATVLDEIIEIHSKNHPFLLKILDYRKLNKALATYVTGILTRQIDGHIYTSYLLHGTTSGRFASRNPNCQNLPSIKEDGDVSPLVMKYSNAIRRGFKAPAGSKVVNADFSRLEVMCFADTSEDPLLIASLRRGEDLYSAVAIQVEGLHEYSAIDTDPNYLKKHLPAIRQKWKVPPLGIVYGMGEGRLMDAIGCSFQEARSIINNYLNTYKKLKDYMWKCEHQAKTKGFIKTEFGRIRHLPEAKRLHEKYGNNLLKYKWAKSKNLLQERRKLKNLLNNAKNFPIQGKAAHLVNRAAIAINREFKKQGIDSCVRLNTHDELTCIARDDQVEAVAAIMKDKMENTTTISIPLQAEPMIADNWGDAK